MATLPKPTTNAVFASLKLNATTGSPAFNARSLPQRSNSSRPQQEQQRATLDLTLPSLYSLVCEFIDAEGPVVNRAYQLAERLEFFSDAAIEKVLVWVRRTLKAERTVLEELKWASEAWEDDVEAHLTTASAEEEDGDEEQDTDVVGLPTMAFSGRLERAEGGVGGYVDGGVDVEKGVPDLRAQLLEVCVLIREVAAEVDELVADGCHDEVEDGWEDDDDAVAGADGETARVVGIEALGAE